MAIKLKVSETSAKLKATSTDALQFGVEQGIPIYPDPYEGSYEVTPTEAEQTLGTKDLMMTDDVTVGAIPSDYVGSEIDRRDSSDLTSSGATVSVPSGFYEENASKSVQSGSEGTPTATKSTVSNHSVSVTPSVTNTTGWITGSTKTGTAVTVSASELVSGNKNITQSGSTDITNYATATVPNATYLLETSGGFYTDSGVKKFRIRPDLVTDPTDAPVNKGWIDEGTFYGDYAVYNAVPKNTTVTPSTSSQTIGGARYMMEGAVTVSPMPSGTAGTPTASKVVDTAEANALITPSVTNTTGYITGGTKTGTPFYVTAQELVSGNSTVCDDAGNWNVIDLETLVVPAGTAGTPALTVSAVENHSKTIRSSVINQTGWITGGTVSGASTTVSASDLVSGSQNITSNANNIDVTNLASVNVQVPTGTPSLQTKSKSYTPTESQQTEAVSADTGYDGLDTVNVTVGAISSTYVGTGIDRRDSTNLSASGATVTAPAGYYASQATKTVASGTAGTPTATKGTVSNHSVSVTPSVTNTTGYITGSTKTGTAVTVSASELVSGSETKTANGTYDVTNLAQLVVNVSGGGSSNFTLLGTKSLGTISTSSTTDTDTGQTIVLTGWNDYDLLVCECSVNTKTNGRHACSTRLAWLTASSAVGTKNGCTFATATWNCKLSSSGTATTRSSTTPYGVYAKAGTISGSNLTLTIYQRYNSTQTGTINGSYTMRVYGCKIYDLIGG